MGKKKNNKKNSNKKQNNQSNQNNQNKIQGAKAALNKKKVAPEVASPQEKEIKFAKPCIEKDAEVMTIEAEEVAIQEHEEIAEETAAQTAGQTPEEESFKAVQAKQRIFGLSMEAIYEKLDDIWNFISETRKISVPLIILIYTAVVVSITIPIEHANVMRKIDRQTTLVEQMAAQQGGFVLEKDVEVAVSPECKVVYRGFEFTKSVKAQNSNQFGNAYENHSENNTYLDIKLEYTHSGTDSLKADKAALMTAKSGQAQYLSFAAIETDEGKNIEFANGIDINSGETVQLHYIFDVPKSLESSEDALQVDVVLDNRAYSINLR